jgi:putative ABC transport system permease protein
MIKNYLKIAWRNLLKNKVYSLINLVGLSLSVTFCLLLFFYIRNEQSFDSFHKKKDRLFRLEMTSLWGSDNEQPKPGIFSFLTKQDDIDYQLAFPIVASGDMENTFPEIKSITRFKDEGGQLVRAGKGVFKENHILYADENFFNNFSFPLKKGNPRTALLSDNNIILSETVAKKYFGMADPIGKMVSLTSDSNQVYTVAGIAADAPVNSSIQFGLVIPLHSYPSYSRNMKERFNRMTHLFVVELNIGVDAAKFEDKLNAWVKEYFVKPYVNAYGKSSRNNNLKNYHWHLRPLPDCHYNVSGGWGHYTNAKNIYQLACLVIVILSIASLNYVLLTVSNAASRSQEVGVRKVMGAKRNSIILQFWIETQILVGLSVMMGLVLTRLFLPFFNSTMDVQLRFDHFSWEEILPTIIILSLGLGIVAGYYPALLIAKMKPASIIKSFQTFKITPRFSRMLVVLQYTCCVVLMIASFVINRQMQFVNNKDLGFDKEQILMVKNPVWDFRFTKHLREGLYAFARTQPAVLQYSGISGGLDGGANVNGFILNGEQKWLRQIAVDYNYFDMLGLKFIEGRPFSAKFPSDTVQAVQASVVNETLFNLLGKEATLGVYNKTIGSTIVGVVKDYHYESLTQKIEPQQHIMQWGYIGNFLFKIKAGEMQPTIAKIEKEWKRITNNYPFEYSFLDQRIANMYQEDMRWEKTIQGSCFFAILISCMGLFGLSAINAINRRKEVGIRKVLGAGLNDIFSSLSINFLFLVGIAIAIAIPIAWWIMSRWLEDFAFRIHLNVWQLLSVGLIALLIALFTVSFQAIKAGLSNPVNALRNE